MKDFLKDLIGVLCIFGTLVVYFYIVHGFGH
jgi:hypothetical protein